MQNYYIEMNHINYNVANVKKMNRIYLQIHAFFIIKNLKNPLKNQNYATL